MLLIDPVSTLAALGFEGLDRVPGLLHCAGHESTDGVPLPAHFVHDLGQRGSVLPLQHRNYLGRLAALARRRGFRRLGGRFGFGRGFAGSAAGLAATARLWMRSQMRLAAALPFLKRFTASTPGKPFQIATRRSAGQPALNAASSFWLAKESKGVAVAAAASSVEPNAEMLFCSSIVKVVIIVLLGAALCAVMTWIALMCLKSKAIV
jgi:hypothetical protein